MLKTRELSSKNIYYILALLAFLFLYILAINFLNPLWADDYARSLPLANLNKIFSLVYQTYFTWSGRFAVIFLTYLFLWKDTLAIFFFNLLNSFVFILALYFIFLNAFARRPSKCNDLLFVIIILGLFWFLPTSLGEVAFWKTGAIGYLWPITATLVFIYPVTRLILDDHEFIPNNFITNTLLFIFGLLLGSCLENLSATICLFLLSASIYLKISKHALPRWLSSATFGYYLGTILLIVAPGNFNRAATLTHHYTLIYKILYLTGKILVHFIPFTLIFFLILFLIKKSQARFSLIQLKRFYLFGALALISAFAMTGVPHYVNFNGRTTFVSDFFAIIALTSLLPNSGAMLYAKFIRTMCFVIMPLLVLDMTNVLIYYHQISIENKLRQTIIATELAQHNKNIVVPPMSVIDQSSPWLKRISAYRCFSRDITIDKNNWSNQAMKEYYNLDSIKLNLH